MSIPPIAIHLPLETKHGMRSVLKNFWHLIKESAEEFADDHASKLSASLAYYTLFSIGPLLLVLITILGFFVTKVNVTEEVFNQVASVIGTKATLELQTMISNMSVQRNTKWFGIVGALVFIFGATGIFAEIQSSLNYIWSIKAKPRRGWLKYFRDRLLSFVLVLVLGLLFMVSVFVNVVIDVLSNHLQRFLGSADVVLLKMANFGLFFIIVTTVFTVIFKVLPDAKIHLKDAIVGAIFTAVLFILGKFLISYYLGISRSLNIYGAATSLILILTWVYYSSMILYFGAEFTEVYAKMWGRGITVNKNSVHVIRHETTDILHLKHQSQRKKKEESPDGEQKNS